MPTPESDPAPQAGEVWQDAEGTLMYRAEDGDNWFVFGVNDPIPGDRPAIAYPLARLFDQNGKHVGGDLAYPAGYYARRDAGQVTA
jgi:hypothetical protein